MRTQDILITRQMLYHCAETTAHLEANFIFSRDSKFAKTEITSFSFLHLSLDPRESNRNLLLEHPS